MHCTDGLSVAVNHPVRRRDRRVVEASGQAAITRESRAGGIAARRSVHTAARVRRGARQIQPVDRGVRATQSRDRPQEQLLEGRRGAAGQCAADQRRVLTLQIGR